MKAYLLLLIPLMLLAACTQAPESQIPNGDQTEDMTACTMDAKICPDGSAVGRVAPNCEFAPCPIVVDTPADSNQESGSGTSSDLACDTSSDDYVGKTPDECSRIRFVCVTDKEYFSDDCGCGCKAADVNDESVDDSDAVPGEGKLQAYDCTPEQRGENMACTLDYNPVCGWNDPAKIQCIRYPCAMTYSNACQACANENVISYTKGECPP